MAPLPKVPQAALQFLTTIATAVDGTTSTFTDVPIGVPHKKRLVILAGTHGGSASFSGTVNGITDFIHWFGLFSSVLAFNVVDGTTATITITNSTSTVGKAFGVYVAYPNNPVQLEFISSSTPNDTNPAVLNNIKVQAGGFLVYGAAQNTNAANTFTFAWTGPDAVIEDVDALIEVNYTYTAGHVPITVSSDLDDGNLSTLLSSTKVVAAFSWGPPAPGN